MKFIKFSKVLFCYYGFKMVSFGQQEIYLPDYTELSSSFRILAEAQELLKSLNR